MRTRIPYLAALALLLWGCAKNDEPATPSEPDPQPKTEVKLYISLEAPEGVNWPDVDQVRVFTSASDATGTVLSRSSEGYFTVTDLPQGSWTVCSPASRDFPTAQTAAEGTVPPEAAFAEGGLTHSGSSSNLDVTLLSQVGGFRLRPVRDDVYAVTLQADGRQAVRLQTSIGLMDKRKDWPVALMPTRFPDGLNLKVETLTGSYEVSVDGPLTISAGSFQVLEIPDAPTPEPPAEIPIPDANFKAWLLEHYDADNDSVLSPEEALSVTSIEVSTLQIASLEGIGYFTNLQSLSANGARDSGRNIIGQLTALDLSGLTQLTSVTCRHNHLESLILSGNDALQSLVTYGNSLTRLDLSGAPQLQTVDAGDCAIAQVNLNGLTRLQTLYLHNNRLTELDVRECIRLEALTCDRNLLRTMDLSACPSLSRLDCAPMQSDAGVNLLESITLAYGTVIAGITVNRSEDVIPPATSILWADAPETPLTPGTGLRTLHINTPGGTGIYSKDYWTENCTVRLMDDAGTVYYENSAVSVKGRGNSTWNYAKKPYTLKLPAKADLIGTGADKRWVLLANWMDRTLLRNDVAFELARRTSLEWTPHGEFVELYLNGTHLGNYWLGEKIKTGNSRLQADFLFEMDTYYDAQWRFYSSYGRRVNQWATGMPIGVKEPDDEDMTDELLYTLKNLVDQAERSIYTTALDYKDYLDVNSFVDWYLVHELTYNGEPNHPKSCYFYFRDGRLYAGPVWDFDWYTYQLNTSGLFIRNAIYFDALLSDPDFVSVLKSRWAQLKPSFQTIGSYIDAKAEEIRSSEALNWSMWPCTSSSVNGDERISFSQSVTRMKNALTQRISALDSAIGAL